MSRWRRRLILALSQCGAHIPSTVAAGSREARPMAQERSSTVVPLGILAKQFQVRSKQVRSWGVAPGRPNRPIQISTGSISGNFLVMASSLQSAYKMMMDKAKAFENLSRLRVRGHIYRELSQTEKSPFHLYAEKEATYLIDSPDLLSSACKVPRM